MFCPPLPESRCRLLPGLGHAVLGDGRGGEQVQVQLEFSGQGANHAHEDCLGLVWYAHGREMTGDIGYERNKLRRWAADYRRQLDLDQALVRITYRVGDARYTREVFASAADPVIVVRLTCDRPVRISFDAALDTPHAFARCRQYQGPVC